MLPKPKSDTLALGSGAFWRALFADAGTASSLDVAATRFVSMTILADAQLAPTRIAEAARPDW